MTHIRFSANSNNICSVCSLSVVCERTGRTVGRVTIVTRFVVLGVCCVFAAEAVCLPLSLA